jgi:hypothetical protein
VLRTGGRTILIDSCIGDDRDRPQVPVWNQRHNTGFLDRIAPRRHRSVRGRRRVMHPSPRRPRRLEHAAGRRPLRADLPQRPLSVRPRGAFRLDGAARGRHLPPLHGAAIEDSVVPILEAGLADLVDGGHDLAPGLTLTPLPGHTSGQLGVVLEQRGGRAIFCADAMHTPVQIYQPDLSAAVDTDPATSIVSRRALL